MSSGLSGCDGDGRHGDGRFGALDEDNDDGNDDDGNDDDGSDDDNAITGREHRDGRGAGHGHNPPGIPPATPECHV